MSEHNHSVPASSSLKSLLLAIIINTVVVIFEISLGVITGSMVLVTDAIHNVSDISSMVLGYWSEKISKKPNTNKKTFGYKKIEFITSFANSIVLLMVILWIIYESINRLLFANIEVQSQTMFVVALVALLGNTLATLVLQSSAKENFNLKAVWLHSLQDALFSLAAVAGSVIIYFTNWNLIDPILSITISLFILNEIYKIIRQSVNGLLDSVPVDIDFAEVKAEILKEKNIQEVLDLHIWETDSHTKMLSAHLIILDVSKIRETIQSIKKNLDNKFEIEHTTLQTVEAGKSIEDYLHCN